MKTITRHSFVRAFHRWCAGPGLLLAAAVSVTAAEPKPKPPAEPKTHALFMGADIQVEHNKKFYRVVDVEGGSFVIKVDGKPVKIPADFQAIKLKVDRSLKLTGTSVVIDRLKAERAYTEANDPTKQFMRTQSAALAGQDAAASALARQDAAQMFENMGKAAAAGSPQPNEKGFNAGNADAAAVNYSRAASESLADQGRANSLVGRMQDGLTAEQFDAMDVSFEVSAAVPILKPYVVVMVQYATTADKPGETNNWVYAAALEQLGTDKRRFSVRKGGFPPGFKLAKSQVHVYDGGQELASNVAEKQVPLTRTEAFTYLLLDYLNAHKQDTLPAKAVVGRLTIAQQGTLSPAQFEQPYYLKVNSDGVPSAVYRDSGCTLLADEAVRTLAGTVRCFPALEKGKAVEGVAELKFGRLTL